MRADIFSDVAQIAHNQGAQQVWFVVRSCSLHAFIADRVRDKLGLDVKGDNDDVARLDRFIDWNRLHVAEVRCFCVLLLAGVALVHKTLVLREFPDGNVNKTIRALLALSALASLQMK